MKNTALLLSSLYLLLGLFFLGSCVSKKKYLSSLERISRMKQDSTDFEQRIEGLDQDKNNLRQEVQASQAKAKTLSLELEGREKDIQQKELLLDRQNNLLYEKAQQLNDLQTKIDQQNQIVNNLKNTVANALVNFADDELTVNVKSGKVYLSLSENLLFPSGSSRLDKQGAEALGKLASVLNTNPNIEILIEGHTDSIPISSNIYKDNWDLSVARATSIVRLLANEYKVDGSRLTASGRAEYQPVDTNTTKEGRAKNRRTEIILSPKLEELFELIENTSQ